ncbi:MAG: BrnT family toxin [Polyangiaceae bacterium]|nr:BrnT family toxin [Polyangiaceae bacterium]
MATVIFGDFEWDAEKASANRRKHGVSFEEAAEAMRDPHSVDFDDIAHPENIVTLAMSPRDRILYVVTTQRGERVRIISARTATSHERHLYEDEP